MQRRLTGLSLFALTTLLAVPAVAAASEASGGPRAAVACADDRPNLDRDPARLSAQERCRIAELEARLVAARAQSAADVARLQGELLAAREALVADLSSRDPAYAEEIALFRREVTDIASTPEGGEALVRYNAGDRVGGIAVLDRLRRARDAARLSRADLNSAAEARRVATLGLDARGKSDPAFGTDAVIVRYEEVVRLDPLHLEDWRRLAMLYRDAGRAADAEAADARVVALTIPDGIGRP